MAQHFNLLFKDGQVLRWLGRPDEFERIGNDGRIVSMVADGDALFLLFKDGQVLRWLGRPDQFERIGNDGRIVSMVADGDALFLLFNDGQVLRWLGRPDQFERIGNDGRTVSMVADGDALFLLFNDGQVLRWLGRPDQFERIGNDGRTVSMVADGDALFLLFKDGQVLRWLGRPDQFERIGNDGRIVSMVADGDALFLLFKDGQVLRWLGRPDQFERIGNDGRIVSMVADGDALFLLFKDGQVLRWLGRPDQFERIGNDGRIVAMTVSRDPADEDAIARRSMAQFHRQTGGVFGRLGVPVAQVRRTPGTGYVQDFQMGTLRLDNFDGQVKGEVRFEADVTLAAVQVFGTQDNGNDESYVVMSLVTVDPANPGAPVQTQRTGIQDAVKSGDTLFKNAIRMRQSFTGTSGIMVHLAVWDHESGNQDDIRDSINKVLVDAASKAASTIAGGDLSGQGGLVGDIMNFEVGGVKPFQILSLGVSSLLASAFADDLIGEHVYVIPAQNIVDLADQNNFTRSIRPTGDALDFDVQFNWPPRPEDEFVFTDGNGTYKVYLRIAGVVIPSVPVLPALP